MYSSNQYDYQKSSAPTAPSGPTALPPFSHPTAATGIPVNYANQNYHGNNYSQPAHQQGYYGNTQPPPQQVVQPAGGEGPWSSGLCDCCSDVSNCCITCCCPCITFGQISEIVDKGSSSCVLNGALYALIYYLTGCGCMYSCFYRSKLRQQYRLQENPCGDCLVHCCCETCALCQEYRELKSRGFNMAIGWDGNAERQNGGVAMPPVVQGGMNRY